MSEEFGTKLSSLSVAQLREKCETVGIRKTGKKSELIEVLHKELSAIATKLKDYTLFELKIFCVGFKIHGTSGLDGRLYGFSKINKNGLINLIINKRLLSHTKQPLVLPVKIDF